MLRRNFLNKLTFWLLFALSACPLKGQSLAARLNPTITAGGSVPINDLVEKPSALFSIFVDFRRSIKAPILDEAKLLDEINQLNATPVLNKNLTTTYVKELSQNKLTTGASDHLLVKYLNLKKLGNIENTRMFLEENGFPKSALVIDGDNKRNAGKKGTQGKGDRHVFTFAEKGTGTVFSRFPFSPVPRF